MQFAADTGEEQAVPSWLQTLCTHFFLH